MKLIKWITTGAAAMALVASAHAAGGAKTPVAPEGGWEFEGMFGKFDDAAVQRGYQVYREICSSCHSMNLVSFRKLGEPGGPYYQPGVSPNDNELVKAFAAEYTYTEIDDFGDEVERPGRVSDTFRNPYANEQQARAANGGALPPDFSVIVKAREGGADYVYSLIKGYPDDPDFDGVFEIGDEDHPEHSGTLTQPVGLYYNPYFPGDTKTHWEGDPRHAPYGGFLAMAPQLTEPDGGPGVNCEAEFNNVIDTLKAEKLAELEAAGESPGEEISASDLDPAKMRTALDEYYGLCFPRVAYYDGTFPSKSQIAHDVTAFLAWASEPKQEFRRSTGLAVMIFLLILATLLWFSYRRIWRNVEH